MNTKQLRQKILDLAIRGKLVPQDPNDEPASVLLARVKAEKERLIAEGKIKRSKKTAVTSDKPHYPFDLPNSWCWVQLDEVADIARGGSPRPISQFITDDPNGVNWIKIGDTEKDGKYINSCAQKIIREGVRRSRMVKKGDFLLTNSMSFGRPYILNVDGCIHDGWLVISPISKPFEIDFLYYLLSSSFAYNQFSEKAGGAVVSNLNIEKVAHSLFPLPPIYEQKRIVVEIELILDAIDIVNDSTNDLSLAIANVKTKVLELAISGKLVPQDPADEPAEELLRRINPSAVPADKSHYNGQNLPNGWIQCKFSDLFNVRSARRVHKADWRSEGIPFYRAREIGKLSDLGTVDNDLYIDNLLYSEFAKSGVPQSGDIMITAVGTLGKTYIVRKGGKFYYKDGSVLCIENRNGIDPRYIEMFISSSHFKEQYIWESQGTTVATLTMDRINSYSFVLPPLNEQKRIVSKVDELFAVIDQIQQSLE